MSTWSTLNGLTWSSVKHYNSMFDIIHSIITYNLSFGESPFLHNSTIMLLKMKLRLKTSWCTNKPVCVLSSCAASQFNSCVMIDLRIYKFKPCHCLTPVSKQFFTASILLDNEQTIWLKDNLNNFLICSQSCMMQMRCTSYTTNHQKCVCSK